MALFEPPLEALNGAGVRYVGVGVVLQGHPRLTADLDLAVDPALGRPLVDEPIPFEDLFERADSVQRTRIAVRVASIPDLIRLKRLAARPHMTDAKDAPTVSR